MGKQVAKRTERTPAFNALQQSLGSSIAALRQPVAKVLQARQRAFFDRQIECHANLPDGTFRYREMVQHPAKPIEWFNQDCRRWNCRDWKLLGHAAGLNYNALSLRHRRFEGTRNSGWPAFGSHPKPCP